MRDPDRLLTVVLFWNLVINLSYFAVSLVTAKHLYDAGHSALAGLLSLAANIWNDTFRGGHPQKHGCDFSSADRDLGELAAGGCRSRPFTVATNSWGNDSRAETGHVFRTSRLNRISKSTTSSGRSIPPKSARRSFSLNNESLAGSLISRK